MPLFLHERGTSATISPNTLNALVTNRVINRTHGPLLIGSRGKPCRAGTLSETYNVLYYSNQLHSFGERKILRVTKMFFVTILHCNIWKLVVNYLNCSK